MLLRVMYFDGRYDFVNGATLNQLIQQKSIQKFKRSSGWVDIHSTNIRDPYKEKPFSLMERREHLKAESLKQQNTSPII